jgi:hypothetical protein
VRSIEEPSRDIPVVAEADVVVVGGGPSGLAAALSAARNGASTVLVERYGHVGGLATGGLVIYLDDWFDGAQRTVAGIAKEVVDRLRPLGGVVEPAEETLFKSDWALWKTHARWGFIAFHSKRRPKETTYCVIFDAEMLKYVAGEMLVEAGVILRLHSWAATALCDGERVVGVAVESKEGRQALLGKVVIDTTGDGDVFATAGADFVKGQYMATLAHRLGGVNTERALRFEQEEPDEFKTRTREVVQTLGGTWGELWWWHTGRDGVVWCNCPHLRDIDGLSVDDLTRLEIEGRRRILKNLDYVRVHLPGFEGAYVVDTACQADIRQTRLLVGEYVLTKDDVVSGRTFPDSIGRGRSYHIPYRTLLPRGVENLLVAGRCYSATPDAQKISREIPPCMVMGQAAGTAGAMAAYARTSPRAVDLRELRALLTSQGAIL